MVFKQVMQIEFTIINVEVSGNILCQFHVIYVVSLGNADNLILNKITLNNEIKLLHIFK